MKARAMDGDQGEGDRLTLLDAAWHRRDLAPREAARAARPALHSPDAAPAG